MFTDKWKWPLSSKNHRITIEVIGTKGRLRKQAIFDTGSSNCVFSEDDFDVLFKGEPRGKAMVVHGVGCAYEISRRVTVRMYSAKDELIEEITNVSASFVLNLPTKNMGTGRIEEIPFDEAIIGVSNLIDRFK